MKKRVLSVFLVVVMVVASTCIVVAESNPKDVDIGGGYTVTYEAYCYDTHGGASTYVYAPYAISTHVDASVTLYAYNGDLGNSICAGTAYDYDDWNVDVTIGNLGDSGYVGDHVITEHSVYVEDAYGTYSDSDDWFAVN